MARRHVLGAMAAVLAAALSMLAWTQVAGIDSAVDTHRAAEQQMPGVGALGRVEPTSRIRRLSHPGGFAVAQVGRLLVEEGDRVNEGDIIAVFVDADFRDAAVLQAEAAVELSRAALVRVRAARRAEEIEAQRARLRAFRVAELSTLRDAERAESLVPFGASGAATAERARFAASRATAERSEAEAILQTMLNPRAEDVAVAEAELSAAVAALRRARAEAALTQVVAPISATVLKIHARPGELVGPDGLLDLGDLRSLDVVADVHETDAPRVRLGARAEIIVPGEDQRLVAVVREIGRMVRRTTQVSTNPVAMLDARTLEVRLRLSEEARLVLEYRINLQVQISIDP